MTAQTGWDLQGHGLVATGERFVGAGVGAGRRLTPRLGLVATLSVGALEGSAGTRMEVLTMFRPIPSGTGRAGVYALAGLAVTAGSSDAWERLVVSLGIEHELAAGSSVFLEGGAGGGFRLVAGWRRVW